MANGEVMKKNRGCDLVWSSAKVSRDGCIDVVKPCAVFVPETLVSESMHCFFGQFFEIRLSSFFGDFVRFSVFIASSRFTN